VYGRLRSSAYTPELRGRASRIYLTSAVWNLQRRRGFTALSRGLFGLAALLTSAASLPNPSFWQGLLRPYHSPTFARGFESARKAISPAPEVPS
jgi:hypothetical protein